MKKLAVLLMTLLLSAVLCMGFVGCRSTGNDINEGNEYTDDAVTITVAIKADTTERTYMSAFSRAFNEVNKSIKIELITFADYQQAMNNYIASDSMPDVVYTTGDGHHPYSGSGHYLDLTPYFERDGIDVDDYYSMSIDSARMTNDPASEDYDGIYFMPRDYNRLTIMYNKDIFDKAGLAYPTEDWTWDDFISVCRQLREKMNNNENGLSTYMYPADLLLNGNVGMFTALTMEGGRLVDENGMSVVNSQETQLAYEALRNYVKDGLIIDPTKSSSVSFERNTIAISACVRPVLPNYINDVNMDFVSYPLNGDTGLVAAGCNGYAISATSEHKEEAWEFVKFIGSEAGQRAFATTSGCVPVLRTVAEDENATWRQFTNARGDQMNHAAFIDNTDSNGNDRDLYLNIFDKRDPRIMQSLLTLMGECGYSCLHDTYNGRGSIAAITAYYQEQINEYSYIG